MYIYIYIYIYITSCVSTARCCGVGEGGSRDLSHLSPLLVIVNVHVSIICVLCLTGASFKYRYFSFDC